MPLLVAGQPERRTEPIEGTLIGRAYATSEAVASPSDDGVRVCLPLLDGTERVGVLTVTLPEFADYERRVGRRLAGLVAELVVTKSAHTDLFLRTRRRQQMVLAAEMRWRLLPPLMVSTPRVAVAGVLEPAYTVGGDAFDYAINDSIAHVAIFDAMGHETGAAVMASLVVAEYRYARRRGVGLTGKYEVMDAALSELFGAESFATAQMADLHLDTGVLSWVNAGHPVPLLMRGHHMVRPLLSEATLPVGFGGAPPLVAHESLEPGDRVLFYTDGVVEERNDRGEPFGEERLIEHLVRESAAGLTGAETVRCLSHALLQARDGKTSDDATLLLVEWRGRGRGDSTG